ncbi:MULTISPECIES: 2-hydroxymuconate tautomerase [Solibacillus]|uniref:Tautomerase n=2 Tax=Solibacillus TaxID=648800 RepID=A0ABR8Y0J9_9BACL|nr:MULTISPECIES: 2-hydroxymuconate tautomerase [Solibacillus]MBD8032646.1 4-oxalocrotonate tautomerase [Solibacillus merdavium]MBD8037691.1 4-oxalocrotonate tautomerase [Solibacillus faecavium]
MPIVTIKMVEGRTEEQKRALVEEVTQAVSKTVDAPVENVSIIIEEMSKNHFAKGGVRYSDN